MNRNLVIIAILLINSCVSNHNYIVPYDLEKDGPDFTMPMTEEEIMTEWKAVFDQIETNTLGKELPNINITSVTGGKFNLKQLINQTTLIYVSDSHCPIGSEGLENDLPKTLEKLKKDSIFLQTIVLLEKLKIDYDDSEIFNAKMNFCKELYPNFYIIEEVEATKLDKVGDPWRILVDSNQIVLSYRVGINTQVSLYDELKTKLLLTNAQRPARN